MGVEKRRSEVRVEGGRGVRVGGKDEVICITSV